MILNVSSRTDIVAFYCDWFWKRYQEGFVDVRNPFYPKLVNRIYFEDVDLIFFCTKNPIPILKYLKKIEKPILFHITVTPYHKEIEPNVPPKGTIIKAIQKISEMIGTENTIVRYDPIFLSETYSVEYHKKSFEKLCFLLEGYVKTIVVSFIDDYQNVRKNRHILKIRPFTEIDYQIIGTSFSESAKRHGMVVQTCFEKRNLTEYGFVRGECLSLERAYKITGKKYTPWKARKEGICQCAQMVDIGVYNSCSHFCKYCYANYDEKKVNDNKRNHDINASLLVGHLENEQIKIRK